MSTDPPGMLARPCEAIGILGGGQLGRMLALAAADLGLDVHVFTPERDSPASRVARRTWVADWSDAAALAEFAASCKVVTLEFENVPTQAVDRIVAAGVPVRPDARALATAQDRLAEKVFFTEIGLVPAPFRRIDSPAQIAPMLAELGGDAILKTRFSGYDGKGQVRLTGAVLPDAAWMEVGAQRSVLEGFVRFDREISVVCARGADGAFTAWDPPQNTHAGGILRRSVFPAPIPADVRACAIGAARTLAEALDYVGVLALELFVTADGDLVANEFACRVHNSGHWTADACLTGQFEQHVRAVCGWPLGPVDRHSDGEMENLLGEDWRSFDRRLAEGDRVRLYGKRRAEDGRKMGHVVRLRPKA
jgi:5-(carboxyamino)imidazole ribonucleotide synthase